MRTHMAPVLCLPSSRLLQELRCKVEYAFPRPHRSHPFLKGEGRTVVTARLARGFFFSGDKATNGNGEANKGQFALALMDYAHTPNMTYLCVVPSCWNELCISTPLLYIPPIRGFQYAIRHGSGLVCGFQFLPFGVSQPCSTRHSPIYPSSCSIAHATLWQFPPVSGGCSHPFAAGKLCIYYC